MKETIVFVHGMSHGAWCWEESFIPYFEKLGYTCVALNLPGHEKPGSAKPIHHSLSDYVNALAAVVDTLPEDPIIIGHSMGGMILQRYLSKGRCKKAILMSSVPPAGVLLPSLRILSQYPGAFKFLFQADLLGVFRQYPHLMFGAMEGSEHYAKLMCAESFWAYLHLLIPIGKIKKHMPILVMGGTADELISVREFEQTASRYGAELILFEGGSHDLMLERSAKTYVDAIHSWITSQSA